MKLFGLEIKRAESEPIKDALIGSTSSQNTHEVDVTSHTNGSDFFHDDIRVILDFIYDTQQQLITKYRDIAEDHYVSEAVDDVLDDAIALHENDGETPVTITVDKTEFTNKIKKKIEEEFNFFTSSVYNVSDRLEDDFKNWYIDGQKSCYLVGEQGKGLTEMRDIDSLYLNKIVKRTATQDKNIKLEEMWIYDITKKAKQLKDNSEKYQSRMNELHFSMAHLFDQSMVADDGKVELTPDSIAHANSGLRDKNGFILSYLHRAIKPHNDLRNFENSMLIYTIARAPQRRIFNIGVGLLSGKKAEKHVQEQMNKHKNKLAYNEKTGALSDSYNIRSMLEDYWFPQQEGDRGATIDTLDGAGELSSVEQIKYYQGLLWKALKSPMSRRMEDPAMVMLGQSSETTRDEIKRTKFINRLTQRFSQMIIQGFARHLILKNIITSEEYEDNKSNFKLIFETDSFFAEIKETEVFKSRLETLSEMDDFVGKYFTRKDAMKKALRMTDAEIEEKLKEIEEEEPDDNDEF